MRLYESIPAALAWATLLGTFFFSFHLRSTFTAMRKNMKTNWLGELNRLGDGSRWEDVYHLIILPMYNEPYEVVRESFESLARANYPKEKFIVVLATEARAGSAARETGERIQKEYGDTFFKF